MKKNKEDFEIALHDFELRHLTGSSGLVRKVASYFYDLRQPEIDALKAENERLRKDAERYRWLADQDLDDRIFIVHGTNGTWGECGHSGFGGYKHHIDEVIDAAMKETK